MLVGGVGVILVRLTQILWERWAVPLELAAVSCKNFLRNFRKCPENVAMGLDAWRRLLWAQALGDQYNKYADEVYQTWLRLRYELLALSPEIQNLLLQLRQYYFVGLITNGTSRAQWEKIHRLRLENFFDIVLVSGDLPWEKPHRKIFQVACEYLGVEPHQCLMVGDKLETDILGGMQAKLGGTVWVPLGGQDGEEHPRPDYVLENVTDLPSLLPAKPRGRKVGKVGGFKFSLPDLEDGNSNASNASDGS